MWPAQKKMYALQYRGHRKVFANTEYAIFLDEIGSDHYQDSLRNRHREVRKHANKWQFHSSSGWTDYSPQLQAILNSEQESLQKRKRNDPPIATNTGGISDWWSGLHKIIRGRSPTNTGGTSNTTPDWWLALYQKIRRSNKYCYLRSCSAGPSEIYAYSSTETYINRNPTLEQSRIKFEPNKYTGGDYNAFTSPSGNELLVPPYDVGATDIKDFAERYDIHEWNLLYREIMKQWEKMVKEKPASRIWVDTDGHAVEYLHIRFEQTPLYNPKPGHTRL